MTRFSRIAYRFRNDERGLALVMVSIMLPVLIAFSLLVIDWSRAGNLHNDLQKGADAMALAAAYELDARADAIQRADRAIANLVKNGYRFSTGDDPQEILEAANISRRYLRSIPADDATPIRSTDVITDEVAGAVDATFVEVVVNPTGFAAIFPASFLSGNTADDAFNVKATAVAGNAGSVVCEMLPVFICNPFPGEDLYEIANEGNFYNKGIKLVIGGTTWGPGNFGFLRPESAHGYGENELARDIARGELDECVNVREVFTQTGNLSTLVKAAFNTRFDMYHQGGGFPSKTDPRWPPAPNVRRGFEFTPQGQRPGTDPCSKQLTDEPTRFRQMTTDRTYSTTNPQIGLGDWDYEGYLAANGFTTVDMAGFVDDEGNAYTNDNPPSRYDLYKYEIANGLVDNPSVGGETGVPGCHSQVGDADRRLIYAAILDCSDPDVQSQLQGQSGSPPAIGFASFFLTEAVTGNEVLAEIVDIDGAQGRGTMQHFVRENVQLYR